MLLKCYSIRFHQVCQLSAISTAHHSRRPAAVYECPYWQHS
jgi:hypothetical protein